jgi:hypothetical protein
LFGRGKDAIFPAVENGDALVVQALIEGKADVQHKDE